MSTEGKLLLHIVKCQKKCFNVKRSWNLKLSKNWAWFCFKYFHKFWQTCINKYHDVYDSKILVYHIIIVVEIICLQIMGYSSTVVTTTLLFNPVWNSYKGNFRNSSDNIKGFILPLCEDLPFNHYRCSL